MPTSSVSPVRAIIDSPVANPQQPYLQADINTIRTGLGPERYNAVIAAAHVLSIDEAISTAP